MIERAAGPIAAVDDTGRSHQRPTTFLYPIRMSVSSTFEYDPQEYYRALRTITTLTPLRWVVPLFAIGIPAGMIALEIVVAHRHPERGLVTPALSVLPYALLGAFWLALIPWSQRRRAKKLPKLNPGVRGPQERCIDAEGYHSRGNSVNLDVPWHVLRKAVETEQFFLFFYNWQCAYFLAKRPLSPEQVREVRTLTRSGLGERARLLEG